MSLYALFAYAGAALSGVFAAVALRRIRRSPARWAFAAGMALLAAEAVLVGLAADAATAHAAVFWQQARHIAMSFLPFCWIAFAATYARGDADQALRRARWLLALALAAPVGLVALAPPSLIVAAEPAATPDAWRFELRWVGVALQSLVICGAVAVLMSLERTLRAAVGTMRWRIKFMVMGLGVLFLARLYASSQAILYRQVDPGLDALSMAALALGCLLIGRSLLRSGHFEIDLYPSPAALRNSIVIILAGLYLLIVGLAASAPSFLGPGIPFPLKALVVLASLAALAVALQSDRFRLQMRRFVSRHFQRPMFDYRAVWTRFTEEVSSQVEPRKLSAALVNLVADLFQTLSVSIWLADPQDGSLSLAASSSLKSPGDGRRVETRETLERFAESAEPVDIDERDENWSAFLRQLNPGEFPHGGHRLCVPLRSRDTLAGLMILGDRVAGIPFSAQEIDALKCVAANAAAGLLNAALSEKLASAKELEAFQAMAAFFAHDLKNAASTLDIMLQNLPKHWDNPEFRKDALRGIAKTSERISQIVRQLGLLRSELRIERQVADLNQALARAASGWSQPDGARFEKRLGAIPPFSFDAKRIESVALNLLLNAKEAMDGQGEVTLSSGVDGALAWFEVADTGPGMSPDFLAESLFRPFKTTKKTGLGIGLFQCKTIVEAHGGRIQAKSEPGKGTAFHVTLPMSPSG